MYYTLVILLIIIGCVLWNKYIMAKEECQELRLKLLKNTQSETTKKKEAEIKKLEQEINELKRIKAIFESDVDLLEFGLYEPKFEYYDDIKFRSAVLQNLEAQKRLLQNDKVIIIEQPIYLGGSRDRGNKYQHNISKLALKTFNNECDTLIKHTNWDNVLKQAEKIDILFNKINEEFKEIGLEFSPEYLKLKREQLFLSYEQSEYKKRAKEEQQRIREQMREEEKVRKEIERKQKELEEQERREQELKRLLEEAYNQGKQEEAIKYQEELAQLKETIENKKRAISNAQRTKHGTVYVISNIGSFGEDVFKIGLTRRSEPMERVNELGDASVPFKFDVHAFIESDDAPALEYKLHEIFREKSVNKVNYHKEFFRVSLDEIEKTTKELGYNIVFTKLAEAREYRESLLIAAKENQLS